MRFCSRVVALVAVVVLLAAGSAMALPGAWPDPPFVATDHSEVELVGFLEFITGYAGATTDIYDGDEFFHSIAAAAGIYDVTVIGWEAGHTNVFEVDGNAIFDNRGGGSNFGSWVTVDFDTQEATFRDTVVGPPVSGESTVDNLGLELWVLDKDVTLPYFNDLYLPMGTIIAGFNDSYADDNHDDMIMAYRAVPEPATILLVGAGLAGLAGLRRKYRS